MRLVSRSARIATAIAIGAIVAPSAQASALAGGGLSGLAGSPAVAAHEEGQSFRWIDSHLGSNSSAVRPNPDEQLPASKPSVATPVKVTIVPERRGDRVLSGNLLRTAPLNGPNVVTTATPAVRTTSGSQGFQYDDAAIGAGVMVGLALLGTAGTLAARRRAQLRHP
jgi:hypothetical protein